HSKGYGNAQQQDHDKQNSKPGQDDAHGRRPSLLLLLLLSLLSLWLWLLRLVASASVWRLAMPRDWLLTAANTTCTIKPTAASQLSTAIASINQPVGRCRKSVLMPRLKSRAPSSNTRTPTKYRLIAISAVESHANTRCVVDDKKRSRMSTTICPWRHVITGMAAKIISDKAISVSSVAPTSGLLKKYRPTTSTQVKSMSR